MLASCALFMIASFPFESHYPFRRVLTLANITLQTLLVPELDEKSYGLSFIDQNLFVHLSLSFLCYETFASNSSTTSRMDASRGKMMIAAFAKKNITKSTQTFFGLVLKHFFRVLSLICLNATVVIFVCLLCLKLFVI